MVRSKTHVRPAWGAKSTFIRSAPLSWSAKRVVEEAARAGLRVSPAFVNHIRWREGLRAETPHGVAALKRRPVERTAKATGVGGVRISDASAEFVRLVAEIGTLRAGALIDECRRRFAEPASQPAGGGQWTK